MGKCRTSETRSSLLSEDDWQERLGRRRGPYGRQAGDGSEGAEASWGPAEQSQHVRPHQLAPATPSHWPSQPCSPWVSEAGSWSLELLVS